MLIVLAGAGKITIMVWELVEALHFNQKNKLKKQTNKTQTGKKKKNKIFGKYYFFWDD